MFVTVSSENSCDYRPSQLWSDYVVWGSGCLIFSFCAVFLFSFAIVLSILLQFTDSYYHICIFKLVFVFILQCQNK